MTADREGFVTALRGSSDTGLTDVVPVVFLLFLVWLIVHGPGVVSLDAGLRRWLGRPPDAASGDPS